MENICALACCRIFMILQFCLLDSALVIYNDIDIDIDIDIESKCE